MLVVARETEETPVTIQTFADAERVLATRLPGYESRPQQQRMAAAVEHVLSSGSGDDEPIQGLVEAGCGTGKSLGGLIPAILSGKQTVYATATIALMTQIATKDLPFLEANLGVPFTWALLKGRSNYLCLAKTSALGDRSLVPALDAIEAAVAADPTHSGDFEDFTGVDKREWSNISSTSAECPGKKECPFGEVCFAERAKDRARSSSVVITNTAMLMTDLKVRELTNGWGSMLGEYDAVIVDESHELEEIATSQLSEEIRAAQFERVVRDLRTFRSVQQVGDGKEGQEIITAANEVFASLPKEGRVTLAWFAEHFNEFLPILDGLRELTGLVANTRIVRGGKPEESKRSLLQRRIENLRDKVEAAVVSDDTDLVRYIESDERYVKGQGKVTVKVLKTSPLRVGPFLTKHLWDRVPTVLVSATLSVHGSFDYITDRLGLVDPYKLTVGTPFNYEKQSLLFVPAESCPSPKERTAWTTYAGMTTLDLVQAAGGGALLLFTSRTSMKASYDTLAGRLEAKGMTVLMQGEHGTNKEIANRFQNDTNSVLFALKSFFTGVDFSGDTCRLVVIDKLPFPVPTDPMFEARSNEVDRRPGGSSFRDLSVPSMTLILTQAFGRLIRTKKDRGVVAILDSRLTSSAWGRKIVNNLPDAPATSDLDAVRSFFAPAPEPEEDLPPF